MDEQKIPYIVYEASEARADRRNKRLIIALIISIVLMFASNIAWLYVWCQYDYSSQETSYVDVDGKDGNANYIGNNGDINNGENTSKESTTENTD